MSLEDLRDLQFASLKNLLVHAASNCPYYRAAWQLLALDPRDLKSAADLASWPFIDRDIIRHNRREMQTALPGMPLMKKATGGSSGVPLEFDLDHDSYARRHAAWHRGYGWAGAAHGSRQWHLWGIVGNPTYAKRVKDALYYRLYRRKMTNSYGMSDETIPLYLQQLNRWRPDAIVAYTNPLYDFARALLERGLRPFSPKSIVVGAEKLHDFQREVIERAFQAPVLRLTVPRFMLIGCSANAEAACI